jgi:hypothetical protein
VEGVGVVGDGEFMPIGTMPTSSGRSEGEGVECVGPEESDAAVRRLTASELVWAEAEELNIRAINKKPPQMEGLFIAYLSAIDQKIFAALPQGW